MDFLRTHFDASDLALEEAAEQLRAVTEALAENILGRHPNVQAAAVVDRITRVVLTMLPAILVQGVGRLGPPRTDAV